MANEKLNPYFSWRTEGLVDQDGVIMATDRYRQFLLPFWWENFKKFNDYPVTIVDLGMSEAARQWCQERGEVIKLSLPQYLFNKRQLMSNRYFIQQVRRAWFQKPFAMLLSPYRRTLWLDMDCQVNGNLAPIFSYAENASQMALCYSIPKKPEDEIEYNSGVIAYLHGCPLIQEWARAIVEVEGDFKGDQNVLTKVIVEQKSPVTILPDLYNWRMKPWGFNEKALIIHWIDDTKKTLFEKWKGWPERMG